MTGVCLKTDLRPLTSMLIRWTEELAALDFDVKHRPGQLNTNADALSRREDELMPQPTEQEEKEQTECINVAEEAIPADLEWNRMEPHRDPCHGLTCIWHNNWKFRNCPCLQSIAGGGTKEPMEQPSDFAA